MRKLMLPFALLVSGCGPSNYDDCILENMKGVSDRVAAFSIRNACKNKFTDERKHPASQELTYLEILKVNTSKPEYGVGGYLFNIHNENKCLYITNIVLDVSDGISKETHSIDLELPPLSSSPKLLEIGGALVRKDISIGGIISSMGYKVDGCKEETNSKPVDDFFNQDFTKYGLKQ